MSRKLCGKRVYLLHYRHNAKSFALVANARLSVKTGREADVTSNLMQKQLVKP
jgi:hypothetical protein